MAAIPRPQYLDMVVGRFVRAFAPQRIVLFGSYAKGTQQPASDVDLLVVADAGTDPTGAQRRARQLVADCFPPVDIVFATPEEVAEAGSAPSPFLASILGRGVTLYEGRAADPQPAAEGRHGD